VIAAGEAKDMGTGEYTLANGAKVRLYLDLLVRTREMLRRFSDRKSTYFPATFGRWRNFRHRPFIRRRRTGSVAPDARFVWRRPVLRNP
jgi:hypothetical protein